MNSILLPCSLILQPHHHLQPSTSRICHRVPFFSSGSGSVTFSSSSLHCQQSSNDVSVIRFEDFVEKDWSFLDFNDLKSREEHKKKMSRIISAGKIEESSKVMVSIGSEEFVDELVETSPCSVLVVVHDSLFILACIKEKYEKVKCWQGEVIEVPEKWGPLDVVFLYFVPALAIELDEVFGKLAKHCLKKGGRVVISQTEGRQVLEQQRKEYGDVIVSELPDKRSLLNIAAHNSFQLTHYVDEPGFYLAVLLNV
ncbi:uncharacterized protein [Euphorbia lathyris]|uniref:uncharacterized protein n=1 Tax=Euphorbia lathyris TaxID=212925 RepID=UPI00331407C3